MVIVKKSKALRFSDLIPDVHTLSNLEPEEIAGPLLRVLDSRPGERFNRVSVVLQLAREYEGDQETVARVLMEAWAWLEREGLIAPDPLNSGGWSFVTRRGHRLADESKLREFQAANRLPKDLLHPVIAGVSWVHFVRSDFEMAVFSAFREVEIAVRTLGKYANTDMGVGMMRKAFHPDDGPLVLNNLSPPERQALSDLYAGSIGFFKNPHSHRHAPISDVGEAAETVMLASYLMRIVDRIRVDSGGES